MSLYDMLLTRREVLRAGACSLAGYWFLPLVEPTRVSAQSKVQPRGSARFVILINLDGGQSHVDAWDLKEHAWTPQDFDVKEIAPGVKWPMSLYPNLAKQWGKFSLVRSMEAWDSVHLRAQYTVQSAHLFNPALQKELPPIGSVIAYESAAQRRPTDTLPGYVAVNMTSPQVGLLKSGFLPATYTPFHVDTAVGASTLSMDDAARKEFVRRWELLQVFDERLRNDSSLAAKAYRDYHNHYEGAVSMMSDSRASQVFAVDPADHDRYGKSLVGDGCVVARNLVEVDAGTRFVIVNQTFWDHHGRIYGEANHYKMSRDLDAALGALLEDLSSRRRADGRSLLDETLVACYGVMLIQPSPCASYEIAVGWRRANCATSAGGERMRFYNRQHRYYCGIDLHVKTMYVCILDTTGQVLVHRNVQATPAAFLEIIAPYREDLVVAAECMFTWYWLADVCAAEGIPFVLGHALAMKAIHGGKAKNDKLDSFKIATLLRGGLVPQAYVYPATMRATRDLLRRRLHLVRKRGQLLAHIQNTRAQYQLPEFGRRLAYPANRAGVSEHFPDPIVRKSIDVDLALLERYDGLINDLELTIIRQAKQHDGDAFHRLRSVPGIGKVLALTILYEIHDVTRFNRVQEFASYARLVKCTHTSAGKVYGSGGAKMGNVHLKWAFSEAAVLFLRHAPGGKKLLVAIEKKHGKGKALSILAHKIGRAVFYILSRRTVFSLEKFRAA